MKKLLMAAMLVSATQIFSQESEIADLSTTLRAMSCAANQLEKGVMVTFNDPVVGPVHMPNETLQAALEAYECFGAKDELFYHLFLGEMVYNTAISGDVQQLEQLIQSYLEIGNRLGITTGVYQFLKAIDQDIKSGNFWSKISYSVDELSMEHGDTNPIDNPATNDIRIIISDVGLRSLNAMRFFTKISGQEITTPAVFSTVLSLLSAEANKHATQQVETLLKTLHLVRATEYWQYLKEQGDPRGIDLSEICDCADYSEEDDCDSDCGYPRGQVEVLDEESLPWMQEQFFLRNTQVDPELLTKVFYILLGTFRNTLNAVRAGL